MIGYSTIAYIYTHLFIIAVLKKEEVLNIFGETDIGYVYESKI